MTSDVSYHVSFHNSWSDMLLLVMTLDEVSLLWHSVQVNVTKFMHTSNIFSIVSPYKVTG